MSLPIYQVYQVKAQPRAQLSWVMRDLFVYVQRSFRHIFKNPDQLLGLTIQPIMFMLLFRYVFGGAINTGSVSYVNFLMAGILVQCLAFGSLTTSYSVAMDLQRGIVERFKSLPTISWGVLVGHTTGDLARNLLQSVIMILAGLLVGFRPSAGVVEWLMILGIVVLFTFAFSWLSAIVGLLGKKIEVVQWLGFFLVFPLTFASAAFAPTQSMPKFLRLFAENQPITRVIEAIRALMIGAPLEQHATAAILWCLAILSVSIPVAAYLFRRSGMEK